MERLRRNQEIAQRNVSKSHNVGKPPMTTKASAKKKFNLGDARANRSPPPPDRVLDRQDYFRNKNKSVDLQALKYQADTTLDPQRN
jgi:hypothetical protein